MELSKKSSIKSTRKSGSAFFAVCRGKASEGIDFSDEKGRTVIIIGLPFPNPKDPKVSLKKKYLDDCQSRSFRSVQSLSGKEWYNQQVSRAVNQAIGNFVYIYFV